MQRGLRYAGELGEGKYCVLQYEELLTDLERVSRELCTFLDLGFEQAMLEFHEHVDGPRDGKVNYGQPLKTNNYNKWKEKLSPGEVLGIEEVAFDALRAFGCEITRAGSHRDLSVVRKLGHRHRRRRR
jgi:hypothetical protein